MYAMVDCNNFYASCERVFRPDLQGKPIVVLSNNDGCVIARSEESKKLGLPMGIPTFKAQQLIDQHGVQVFSSNYALYADISSRVMTTLEPLAAEMEIYSIDEAFLQLDKCLSSDSYEQFGVMTQQRVKQYCGMPVSVGIAPTKTLSKLANYAAKKYKQTHGVVDLSELHRQRKLMAITPVQAVWGIGYNLGRRLNLLNIHTALDLCDAPAKQLRKMSSVLLEKTICELRGVDCLSIEIQASPKKEVLCSRTFGKKVTCLEEMSIALSSHVERAAKKLRQEQRLANAVSVFIRTNRYTLNDKQYRRSATMPIFSPSNDTGLINTLAQRLLSEVWRQGYAYQRIGVMLHGLVAVKDVQNDLFHPVQSERSQALMQVLDAVNQRYRHALCYASTVTPEKHSGWLMRRHYLSPAYTTRWTDLLRVK